MKHILLIVASVMLLIGCQSEESARSDVEQVVRDMFAGFSAFDKEAIQSTCTDDFVLLEQGMVWNIDSLINVLMPLKGNATLTYRLEDFMTTIRGATAYTHYWNHGLMEMGGEQIRIQWLESAVFRKEGGIWKMSLLHSTQVEL